MKATNVSLHSLKTWEACEAAIQKIEGDSRNSNCSPSQWLNGHPSAVMNATASKKIAAINKCMDRLWEREATSCLGTA